VEDDRAYQQYKTPRSGIEETLHASLKDASLLIEDSGASNPMNPLQITLELGFWGLYQTSGRTWGSRAVVNLTMQDARVMNGDPIRETVTVDQVHRRTRNPRSAEKNEWHVALRQQVIPQIVDVVHSYSTRTGVSYRRVVSVGSAPPDSSIQGTSQQEQAILNALHEGAADAWGITVESVTEMVDLADVTERTTASRRGEVLSYNVLPEYTQSLSDGTRCVVVEAIIADPR